MGSLSLQNLLLHTYRVILQLQKNKHFKTDLYLSYTTIQVFLEINCSMLFKFSGHFVKMLNLIKYVTL